VTGVQTCALPISPIYDLIAKTKIELSKNGNGPVEQNGHIV